MSEQKTYLGDGVYAEFDGYHVVLTVENGVMTTARIFLEPDVLGRLNAFAENCKGEE